MQTLPFGTYGFGIAVMLVGIMLAIGGIVLGLGYALNDKRLKELGRGEIVQSLINGALVGALILLFVNGGIVDSLVNSLVYSNGTSISCPAFLQGNAAICFSYNYLVGPRNYYYMGSLHTSVLNSVALDIDVLIGVYAVLGLFKLILSPLLAQIQSAVQVLGAAAVSAMVQASVLAFISVSALTVMLPLGLLLRTFYASRRLGSFLIALTIGLYLVLPLTYVMNAAIAGYYETASNQTAPALEANLTAVKNTFLSYVKTGASNASVVGEVTVAGSAVGGLLDSLTNYLFGIVSYFIVYTFIMPAFSLMLTAISVRELALLLGSDNFFGKFNLL